MKVKKLIAFSLIIMVLFVVFLIISQPSAQASTYNMTFAKVSTIPNQRYTGKYIKPNVTVKYSGRTLKKGTDYTLSYYNNKEIGTARVTITGKGIYSREKNCYIQNCFKFHLPSKQYFYGASNIKVRQNTILYRKSY